MEIAAIVIILTYFILHLIFYWGLKRSVSLKKNIADRFPFVSVIVAARNEEDKIKECIDSLKRINYPKDKYEIILVNDNSTDSTISIMLNETYNFSEFKILDTKESRNTKLKGKVNALAYAISVSRGELYMMTDADCVVPPDWLKETCRYFENDTGLICGFTKIDAEKSFFSKLQSLDWLYLQTLASASSGINLELSCIGNNLTVSKSCYDSIGGYENLIFSVTEDLALMRKVKKDKSHKIKYPVSIDSVILTQGCKNLTELVSQKKRWFRGGVDINWLGYLLGFVLYLSNFLFIAGFVFLNINLYFALIILKIMSELILILPAYRIFNFKGLLVYYPLFQLYFALYGLLLPFTFIAGKNITWKDRKH